MKTVSKPRFAVGSEVDIRSTKWKILGFQKVKNTWKVNVESVSNGARKSIALPRFERTAR